MTSSFPPNVGSKCFRVSQATTSMTTTAGTGDTNLIYPFGQYSIEIVLAANPTADDTVTIGSIVYKFVAAPGSINDVDIGADADGSASNLRRALIDGNTSHSQAGEPSSGEYEGTTVINPDILHAEFGIHQHVVHVTAATALTVASAGSGDVTVQSMDGVAQTSMIHYPMGDFTELAASSPEATNTHVQAMGLMAAGDGLAGAPVAGVDKVVSICNHAGLLTLQPNIDGPNSYIGFLQVPTTGPQTGIAARLNAKTDGLGIYVYYH